MAKITVLLCVLYYVSRMEARPQVLGAQSDSYHNSNLNSQGSSTLGSQAGFGTGSLRQSAFSPGLRQQPAFTSNGFGTHMMGTGSTLGMPFGATPGGFMERNHYGGPFSDFSGFEHQGGPYGFGKEYAVSPFQTFPNNGHRTTSGPVVRKDLLGSSFGKH